MAEAPDFQPGAPNAEADGGAKNSSEARLDDLIAQATLKYSIKDYNAAAELYSEATELQAELNGEMSPKNADLLYAYGRCLYHVAVSNSDVLGSKVAGEQTEHGAKKSKAKATNGGNSAVGASSAQDRIAEEVVTQVVEDKNGVKDEGDMKSSDVQPYFQFTGDENFDDSEDDEDPDDGDADGAEAEEEEDDFVNAYEVLDLARILLLRRLEERQVPDGKGKATEDSNAVKQIKERLADTHDLQAEISLEGERFPNAVVDLRASLALQEDLFPKDSSLIAEAHYKLSLALEFSSVTQQKGVDGEADSGKDALVDEAMREEAAKEMEAAIESCKLRIHKEKTNLKSGATSTTASGKPRVTKESIEDVKDMVADMEQRLVELRQPPVSINDPTGTGAIDGANPLSGILGSILGESPAAQKARIEEATKGAHDLTNLVKRKRPASDDRQDGVPSAAVNGGGKRTLEFADEVQEAGSMKKAKVEEATD